MKKLIGFFLGFMVAALASAQSDFTLYQMRAVPQVTSVNPSAVPLSKVNIGLPVVSSLYLSVGNNGFSFSDVVQLDPNTDSLNLNFGGAIDQLRDRNRFNMHFQTDLFSLGFRAGNNYISFAVTEKIDFSLYYPKGLFEFAWYGNGGEELLGQRASFDNLGIDILHYRKYTAGFARRFNTSLSIGVRGSYLYGMEALYTRKSQIGLTTDELTYDLRADAGMEINTAGLNSVALERFSDISNGDVQQIQNYLINGNNTGYSFDFGLTYTFFDLFSIHGAVLDIGQITWRDNIENFTLQTDTLTFTGIDLFDLFDPVQEPNNTDPNTGVITNLSDSVASTFTTYTTNSNSFTTALPTQIFIGADYNLTNKMKIGVLSRTQFVKGQLSPAISAMWQANIGNFFSTSVNYSVYGRSLGNLGVGLSGNLGPLQIYLMTDNALAALQWYQVRNAHFRFGINLTFARDYEY